jgi:hypothetical protein
MKSNSIVLCSALYRRWIRDKFHTPRYLDRTRRNFPQCIEVQLSVTRAGCIGQHYV